MSDPRPLILLVEDNDDEAELALHALESHGIDAEVARMRDGVEALEYLLAEPPRPTPALVLLDLNMPRVGGLEVLRRLRAIPDTRRLVVVVLTTSDEQSDLRRAYDLGANSYILKPIEFDQFEAVVRDLGLYWLGVNRPSETASVGR